jgi:hypothetical protein
VRVMRRGLIAFLIGALLARAVPVVLALVAAAPGLRTLVRAIEGAGLPLAPVYFSLTTLVPALSFSFCVGLVLFRALGGGRLALLAASSAPWVLSAVYVYVDLCVGTPVSCLGAYELAGFMAVPVGLLLAALIPRPARPQHGPASAAIQSPPAR